MSAASGETTKTKRFKVKHPKRKLYRASEPLLSVFMWGANYTVRELQHVSIPVMLMPDDFKSYTKIKVDNQAFNKENLPSHFKVRHWVSFPSFRNMKLTQ
jgi:1-phosphatidylinositol-5-phosphate 4-kinase